MAYEAYVGEWQRDRAENYSEFLKAALPNAPYLARQAIAMTPLYHKIQTDGKLVRVVVMGGALVNTDLTLEIGGPPTSFAVRGKTFKQACYWEAEALVFKRTDPDGVMEGEHKRKIVSDDEMLLLYKHTDLKTGTVTEAKAWFKRLSTTCDLPLPTEITQTVKFVSGPESPGAKSSSRHSQASTSSRVSFAPTVTESTRESRRARVSSMLSSMSLADGPLVHAEESFDGEDYDDDDDDDEYYDEGEEPTDEQLTRASFVSERKSRASKTMGIKELEVKLDNVSYTVTQFVSRKEPKVEKKLLNEVSCRAVSREVLCVMGPSGAGKSTFLSCMLGRTSRGQVDGKITYNGEEPDPELGSVVTQDVVSLRATMTPRSTLVFAQKLCGKPVDVEELLQEFALSECADVVVGDENVKGLSGGQKKRLTIALELVSRPRILALDEPTSGLDSRTALDTTRKLRSVAKTGIVVIAVLHQPSVHMLDLLDKLVLLAKGTCAYFGPTHGAVSFFGEKGFMCPPGENVANYYLDMLVENDFPPYKMGENTLSIERPNMKRAASWSPSLEDADYKKPSFSVVTALLFQQSLLHTLRNRRDFRLRIRSSIFVGLLVGFVFLNLPNKQKWADTKLSLIFMTLVFNFMAPVSQTSIVLATERPWLLNEYHNHRFPLEAWLLSRLGVFLLAQGTYTIVYTTIVYFLADLKHNEFFPYLLIMIMHSYVAGLCGFLIGTFARNAQHAVTFLGPALMPNVIFSGFLFDFKQCPVYFYPMWFLSFFRYSYEAAVYTQFRRGRFSRCTSREPGRCPVGPFGKVKHSAFREGINLAEPQTELIYLQSCLILTGWFLFFLMCVSRSVVKQLSEFSF